MPALINSKAISITFVLFLALASYALAQTPPDIHQIPELPLGSRELQQAQISQELAPGLIYYEVTRFDEAEIGNVWGWHSQPSRSEEQLVGVKRCLEQRGISRFIARTYPLPGDPDSRYWLIEVPGLPSRGETEALEQELGLQDCQLRLVDLREDVHYSNGPWRIYVLEISPKIFDGTMELALARGAVSGKQTVAQIAESNEALAAVNASFFVMGQSDGVEGDITGITVLNGRVVSEPIQGRTAVVLNNAPEISLRFLREIPPLKLRWDDGVSTTLDGVNRRIGISLNCGNLGDSPTELPVHDETCTDSSELVFLTPEAGFAPPDDVVVFAFSYSNGLLEPVSESEAGEEDWLLMASGNRAYEIESRLRQSARAVFDSGLDDSKTGEFVFSGGPLLIANGRSVHSENLEGWSMQNFQRPERALAVHRWINRRNPRTAIGQRADGSIILVAIDGRQAEFSVGVSIPELREVMHSLGARNAMNLDGGGSTSMVVQGRQVNSPPGTRPREVGDALLILPAILQP